MWPSFNSHMFYHLGAMAVHQVAVRIPTFVYVHTSPPPRVFPDRWLRSTQKSCRPMIWKAEFGMLLFNQVYVRQSTARFFISQKTPYLWWSKSILLLRAQMFARKSVGIGGLLAFSLASELACLPIFCLRAQRFLLLLLPCSTTSAQCPQESQSA